ncbi:hypothetical protein [Escherichia coli]|nr:hypothetical protein [Escherichia coli]EFC6904955.1 hypothetical protein [Escherichia coli]EMF1525875.1 hypothetical protein [Escherichia coli]MBB9097174.1 hypothetical protein [Escherichia coli]MBS8520265.1 hypothetical protein [Escherichia coli]MBS8744850.1 hypothetical protein [Escherichia coli]
MCDILLNVLNIVFIGIAIILVIICWVMTPTY